MTGTHKVLTAAGTVTCGHVPFGTVVLAGAGKLRVGGSPVLVAAGVGPAVGAGCTPSQQGDVACATVAGVTGGLSAKLTVGGSPVVLETLAGTTNGIIKGVQGALTVTVVQPKLVAG
jgi:hypothetical protein